MRKLNVTDGRIDRWMDGGVTISPGGAEGDNSARREMKKIF